MTLQSQVALSLLVSSVNTLLATENKLYRVTAADIVMTRRGGYTVIALKETKDAADWRRCAPPYSTMDSHDG